VFGRTRRILSDSSSRPACRLRESLVIDT